MASTRLSYLAVKRETTVATAVKPSHFLRFKSGDISYTQEIIQNMSIQNNRWGAITPIAGKITTEGSFELDCDYNESTHWIAAALGSMSSTDISSLTDASVYKHTITMATSLPSLTLEQSKGDITDTSNNRQNYNVQRAFGVLVDSLEFGGSDKEITLKANLKAHGVFRQSNLISNAAAGSSVALALNSVEGLVATVDTVNIYDTTPQNETDAIASISTTNKTITIATLGNSYTVAKEASVELVPQSPSYATAPKFASFTHASFQFGTDLTAAASASEENIEDWTFTYENSLEERYGSLRSSPSVIAPKAAKATLKFTKYFSSNIDMKRYMSMRKQACILTLTNNEIVSGTDTNQAKYTIKFSIPATYFTSYEVPTGTDELFAASSEMVIFYDTTEGKAIQIEVTNAKAGTEFTA